MKSFAAGFLLIAITFFASCKNEAPRTEFKLMICSDTTLAGTRVQYILTNDSLSIRYLKNEILSFDTTMFEVALIEMPEFTSAMQDTISLIAKLDKKTYDCPEQHALTKCYVILIRNGKGEQIDPNINHPKELDYAIRIINSLVPEKYKLEFVDMQSAIEPDGKLKI